MRAAWLEIDLSAYRGNLRRLRQHCGGRPALAVVKANAYGHGLARVAQAAVQEGCLGVGVAVPEEGLELREAGLVGRVVILGLWPLEQAELVVRLGLETIVSQPEAVAALARAARAVGRAARLHVKVDTGLSRVGVEPETAVALCRSIQACAELRLAGVLTHFASGEDEAAVREQWERFAPLVDPLRALGGHELLIHAANSAATLWFPPSHLDAVRPGLVTYGVPPGARPLPVALEPALSLRGRLTQVREVGAGRMVGYGGAFVTRRRSVLGVVPVGYGDGLPWRLSGVGEVLVRGRRVPLVGRISMDQVVVDVTDVIEPRLGEVVTFLGRDGSEAILAGEIAAATGTIPYEVLTGMAARLPRVYLDEMLVQSDEPAGLSAAANGPARSPTSP